MAVTLQTYGEQLADVQQAISAVNSSQRYEINGRVMQRADLEWLHKRDMYLTKMLNIYGDVVAGTNVTRGAMKVNFEND